MVNFSNGTTPAVNDTNLNKMQTDLQINIVAGSEKTTNMTVGGKQVYVKRIGCGSAPNGTASNPVSKSVAHGLSNVTFVKIEGVAISSSAGLTYPLPFPFETSDRIAVWVEGSNIKIETWGNKSSFTCSVDLYYTKN